MVAPAVASEMVTDCGALYVPAAGDKIGVATICVVDPVRLVVPDIEAAKSLSAGKLASTR